MPCKDGYTHVFVIVTPLCDAVCLPLIPSLDFVSGCSTPQPSQRFRFQSMQPSGMTFYRRHHSNLTLFRHTKQMQSHLSILSLEHSIMKRYTHCLFVRLRAPAVGTDRCVYGACHPPWSRNLRSVPRNQSQRRAKRTLLPCCRVARQTVLWPPSRRLLCCLTCWPPRI